MEFKGFLSDHSEKAAVGVVGIGRTGTAADAGPVASITRRYRASGPRYTSHGTQVVGVRDP